jgi:hypothetical protein
MPHQMANQTCIMCNGSNAKSCSSCHSISYCSQKCQKDDWPLHKTICKAFTTLPSRPSPSHKLAILFPVDSINPQLIWIECNRLVDDEDGIAWESPDTQNLLNIENLDPKYGQTREFKKIRRTKPSAFNLSDTVDVIPRETASIDGFTPNVCVLNMLKRADDARLEGTNDSFASAAAE